MSQMRSQNHYSGEMMWIPDEMTNCMDQGNCQPIWDMLGNYLQISEQKSELFANKAKNVKDFFYYFLRKIRGIIFFIGKFTQNY